MNPPAGPWPGRRPHPALRHWIDRYWAWRAPAHGRLLPLLPGPGGAELLFHQGPPFGSCGEGSAVQLLAVRERPLALEATRSTSFLAVRLRPGAAGTLLGRSLIGLTDACVDARSAWPAVDHVLPRLWRASSFEEQARLLDEWLLESRQLPRSSKLLAAASRLEGSDTTVARAAALCGLSVRQFGNRFKAVAGIPPARCRRLGRFRRTIKALLLAPAEQTMTERLDPTYVDQAQFIHDCRTFIGMPAGEWRRRAAEGLHFYLPGLPPD